MEYQDLQKEKVSQQVYKANRAKKVNYNEGKMYDGVMHRVGFRTHREVDLVGVGFFGPAKVEYADYTVRLEVVKTVKNYLGFRKVFKILGPCFQEEIMMKYDVKIQGVPQGNLFYVKFPEPVKILPYQWQDIKFMLQGEKTNFLQDVNVDDKIDLNNRSFVQFDFLRGSCQVPEILFTI